MKGATPFTLLRWYRQGSAESGAQFVEFAAAFKGRAQLYWSPRLRKKIDLLELQDPQPKPEAPRRIALVSCSDWALVLSHDARHDLLEIAERHGAAGVDALLSELRRKRGRWRDTFRVQDVLGRWHDGMGEPRTDPWGRLAA